MLLSEDDRMATELPPAPGVMVTTALAQNSADSSGSSQEKSHEYLTGLKLFLVMFSITLGGFLMLLDASIIATVRSHDPELEILR